MNHLISLSDVSKVYRTSSSTVNALSHVSLHIAAGEFVSVIGQSGSGKSTLMNILGCLDTPTAGEYFLDNVPVARMNEKKLSLIRNRFIGFIFQSFHLIPSLSALENVELPLLYRGIKKSVRHEKAVRALQMVGLDKRISHKPCELSGGQQQRVAIARAVASQPKLILADEPTGNLDSRSGNDIMDIIRELHRQGTTVVLITHDNGVARMAERCITISDGKIRAT